MPRLELVLKSLDSLIGAAAILQAKPNLFDDLLLFTASQADGTRLSLKKPVSFHPSRNTRMILRSHKCSRTLAARRGICTAGAGHEIHFRIGVRLMQRDNR